MRGAPRTRSARRRPPSVASRSRQRARVVPAARPGRVRAPRCRRRGCPRAEPRRPRRRRKSGQPPADVRSALPLRRGPAAAAGRAPRSPADETVARAAAGDSGRPPPATRRRSSRDPWGRASTPDLRGRRPRRARPRADARPGARCDRRARCRRLPRRAPRGRAKSARCAAKRDVPGACRRRPRRRRASAGGSPTGRQPPTIRRAVRRRRPPRTAPGRSPNRQPTRDFAPAGSGHRRGSRRGGRPPPGDRNAAPPRRNCPTRTRRGREGRALRSCVPGAPVGGSREGLFEQRHRGGEIALLGEHRAKRAREVAICRVAANARARVRRRGKRRDRFRRTKGAPATPVAPPRCAGREGGTRRASGESHAPVSAGRAEAGTPRSSRQSPPRRTVRKSSVAAGLTSGLRRALSEESGGDSSRDLRVAEGLLDRRQPIPRPRGELGRRADRLREGLRRLSPGGRAVRAGGRAGSRARGRGPLPARRRRGSSPPRARDGGLRPPAAPRG